MTRCTVPSSAFTERARRICFLERRFALDVVGSEFGTGVRFEHGEGRVKYTGHLICWVLAGVCLGLLGYDRFIDAFADMTANYFNRGRGCSGDGRRSNGGGIAGTGVAPGGADVLIRHLIWAYDVTGSAR